MCPFRSGAAVGKTEHSDFLSFGLYLFNVMSYVLRVTRNCLLAYDYAHSYLLVLKSKNAYFFFI